MIAVLVTFVVTAASLIALGYWHSGRMYRLGVSHGRAREAMVARHARERMIEAAHREVTIAALRRHCDDRLIRKWVEQAWHGGGAT